MAEYIEREAVCKECIHCEVCDYWEKEVYPNDCEYNDGEPCKYFESAADVAPVIHAKWIRYHEADIGWDEYGYRCSRCKTEIEDKNMPFLLKRCPRCDAKMD